MKKDRSWLVGQPTLSLAAPQANPARGIYVWLEDGWWHLAAVTSGASRKALRFHLESSTPILEKEWGDFRPLGRFGCHGHTIEVAKTTRLARGKFRADNRLFLLPDKSHDGAPIFLGPLAERVQKSIEIGRF